MPLPAIVQRASVRQRDLAAAQTFKIGAVVLLDAAENIVEAGANPATIYGFALHDAAVDPFTTKVLVAEADSASRFWLQGTSSPIKDNIGKSFGLVKHADGHWIVNIADTTNTRVQVIDIDLDRDLFLVNVLAANRQVTV